MAVFGSLTLDEIDRGHGVRLVPGGSALYVPATLAFHGLNVSVISCAGRDFPRQTFRWLERQGVDVSRVIKSAGPSTRFRLTYRSNGRSLRVLHHGGKLDGRIRGFWDAVHLGPVLGEIGPELVKSVRPQAGLVSLDLQGLMRVTDPDGNVRLDRSDLSSVLRHCDVVKMSEKEALVQTGERNLSRSASIISEQGPGYVIITSGNQGATFSVSGEEFFRIPAYSESKIVDSTGAGDCFVGSWVSTFLMTGDPCWAACAASAFSSMGLRRYGVGKFLISRSELFRRSVWVYRRAKRIRGRAVKNGP